MTNMENKEQDIKINARNYLETFTNNDHLKIDSFINGSKIFFDSDNYPVFYEMKKKENTSIFNTKYDVLFSNNIEFPSMEYGFHYFIHQSKNYFNIETSKFEKRKKVWHVVEKYKPTIDNYENNIENFAKEFFSQQVNPEIQIVDEKFYKAWEIFHYFDIINNKNDFSSAHLFDGNGHFTQATMLFRKVFFGKDFESGDNYTVLKDIDIEKVQYGEIDENLKKYISKNKKEPGTYDLVTCDGGFGKMNENMCEKEMPRLLCNEINTAINLLKKGGSFVCKLYETFTKITVKFISILLDIFAKVYIIKPFTSHLSSNEKYIVCLGYKYDKDDKNNIVVKNIIDKLLKKMDLQKNNVVDIFTDYSNSPDLVECVKKMNIGFSNYHYKHTNHIVKYIRESRYFGDEYHEYRTRQMQGAEYWKTLFLSNDLSENRKKTRELLNYSLNFK